MSDEMERLIALHGEDDHAVLNLRIEEQDQRIAELERFITFKGFDDQLIDWRDQECTEDSDHE